MWRYKTLYGPPLGIGSAGLEDVAFHMFDDTQRAIGSRTVPVVPRDATVVEHDFDWNVRRGQWYQFLVE